MSHFVNGVWDPPYLTIIAAGGGAGDDLDVSPVV
jgi:hypothetical protein